MGSSSRFARIALKMMPTGIPRWCREMASGCWGLGGWWSERLQWDVTMNKHTLWDEVNCWIWGDFKHAGCCGHICHLSCALLLTFPVGNFWVALFIGEAYRTTNTHPIIGGGMAGKSIDVSETPFFDHQSHLKQPVLGGLEDLRWDRLSRMKSPRKTFVL